MDDTAVKITASDAPVVKVSEQPASGFTEQVIDYFAAYLRGRLTVDGLPSRRLDDHYHEGLLQTMYLSLFPQLHKNLHKNVVTGLGQETFVITQNRYGGRGGEDLPPALVANANALTEEQIKPFIQSLVAAAEAERLAAPDTDRFVTELLVQSHQLLLTDLLLPLVLNSAGTKYETYGNKAAVQLFVAMIGDYLFDRLRVDLKQLFYAYFDNHETAASLRATLQDQISAKHLKADLQTAIQQIDLNDAYQVVYGLHRAVMAADSRALNLTFGTISYDGRRFPLFYTPVRSKHVFPSITLTFENRVYVNRQAIEFIARHYTADTGRPVTIPVMPHVLDTSKDSLPDELQRLCDELTGTFGLEDRLQISKVQAQAVASPLITIDNELTFCIDPISNGHLVESYQQLQKDPALIQAAGKYLDALVNDADARFIQDIDEAWQDKPMFEKLAPTIPFNASDEQQRILQALEHKDCHHIVVEGGNNTGKHRLLAASALHALTKQQSVLIISRSQTVASRLRETIGGALTKYSGNKKGHNPVLTLDDTTILDGIDEQSLETVASNATFQQAKTAELAAAKTQKQKAAREALAQFIQSAENINLREVDLTVLNERRFAGKKWIEDEPIDAISSDLQRVHRAIQYVNHNSAAHLLPYVEGEQRQAVETFITVFREYEKASKNINKTLPEFIVRYRKLMTDQRESLQNDLAFMHSNSRHYLKTLRELPASSWLGISESTTFETINEQAALFRKMVDISNKAEDVLAGADDPEVILNEVETYKQKPSEIVDALHGYIEQVGTLKSKLFGFSGRVVVIENLNKQLRKSLPQFNLADPEKQIDDLEVMSDLIGTIGGLLAAEGLSPDHWINVIHIMRTDTDKLDEVEKILKAFNATHPYGFMEDYQIREAENLVSNIVLLQHASDLNVAFRAQPQFAKLFGFSTISRVLARPHEYVSQVNKLSRELGDAEQLNEARSEIADFVKNWPAAAKRLGIIFNNNNLEVIDETFAASEADYVKDYLAHKKKEQDVRSYFDAITIDDFSRSTEELRQIIGVELQTQADQGLVDAASSWTDFEALRTSLQRHQRLTDAQTTSLITAFPVVVGTSDGISRTLPLKSRAFDLVIIDGAASLSIAEVLPSALRGKRLLIIGDPADLPKQPRVDNGLDAMYREAIASALRKKLGGLPADSRNGILSKQTDTIVANSSALAFYRQYANYDQTLLKQFGVYEELASFTNKFYHDNALISLTSRAKPLVDLIFFKQLKPTLKLISEFTNAAEVSYIIEQLQKLKDQDFTGTIGIVTPFAEQAALIQKELDEGVIQDWYEQRKLKVMTFDTASHEHRDYVFYSLVASQEYDELSQKFPAQLETPAYNGDVRAARLYAGLNVATRAVHFVHSLPLDGFPGAMGEALQHYNSVLQGTNVSSISVKGAAPTTTDILLPTEANISKAFEDTRFADKYGDRLTFMPKYQFSNYLRALRPDYYKAQYKMFFLVMFDSRPIVLEFDEFKEHFLRSEKDSTDVGATYLTAQDIYWHLVLENYGYRFIRLNKFNVGSDPVRTLDTTLANVTRSSNWAADNGFVPTA